MRIVASVPFYPPWSMVGAWCATHLCLAHMAARGHRVDVVAYRADGYTYSLDGVLVHPGAALDEFTPDVVVSHLGDDGRGASWAGRRQAPSVRMVHGLDELNRAWLTRQPPALTVFNSASLRSETRWPGRSIVVHPPVDIDVEACSGDRVTLVNLAKGGDVLARIAPLMPNHGFLAVRGGWGRQRAVDAPNVETIDSTVQMHADVYARTRVLLMPSEHETWGMVGVEAMARGIPVIAHPTPGLVESLGDAGIFADRTDPAAWVRELRRLDDPDEWAAASAASLARAAQLDPAAQLDRFADAVEALAPVPA